jgi:hypothetical protein
MGSHSSDQSPQRFIQRDVSNVHTARALVTEFVNKNVRSDIRDNEQATLLQKAKRISHTQTQGLVVHLAMRLEATDDLGREWSSSEAKQKANRTASSPIKNPLIKHELAPRLEAALKKDIFPLIGNTGPVAGSFSQLDSTRVETAKERFYQLVNEALVNSGIVSTPTMLRALDLNGLQNLQLPHQAALIANRLFSIDKTAKEWPSQLNGVQAVRGTMSRKALTHPHNPGHSGRRTIVKGAVFSLHDLELLQRDLQANLGPLLRAPQTDAIISHTSESLEQAKQLVAERIEKLTTIPADKVVKRLHPAAIESLVIDLDKVPTGKSTTNNSEAKDLLIGVVKRFGFINPQGYEFPLNHRFYSDEMTTGSTSYHPGVLRALENRELNPEDKPKVIRAQQVKNWSIGPRADLNGIVQPRDYSRQLIRG